MRYLSRRRPRGQPRLQRRRAYLSILTCAALAAVSTGIASASSTAKAVSSVTGIVDVNTNLAYEDAAAAGTGMVLTSSGEVLTNNHVIRGATTIHVTDLDNGRTYSAAVVGYDVTADVAVLQLKNASGLKTAPLGNSATAKIGEAVTAIGNAGGVGGTPSSVTGTITHLNQSITASDEGANAELLHGLIQTDAALQPGDSGGPLVNNTGQVLGMDTAASASFSFGGYGYDNQATESYSIPIDEALTVAHQIETNLTSQSVHVGATPFLGVDVQATNNYYDEASSGVVIVAVIPSSPIGKAGLTAGDVLSSLNGVKLSSPESLTSLLITKTPGTTVTIGWLDQTGVSHSTTIRLASGPPQ